MAMAEKIRKWTLRDLHSLPDDGNKYELVRGELFVTPAPTESHNELVARLIMLLVPYVAREQLGMVYTPRAVVRREGSEVEPDLMVRAVPRVLPYKWEKAPLPLLVIEVASDSTRRRDKEQKRSFYVDVGIPEYWMVDGDSRSIRVAKRDEPDAICDAMRTWQPAGAKEPLLVDVRALFNDALGPVKSHG